MIRYINIALTLCALFLISCEGRTGYFDSDQQTTIATLTAHEWKLCHEDSPSFPSTEFNDEGWIYKFNSNGTGSYKWVNYEDGTTIGDTIYFRWTFTTDNFSVIYIDKSQAFWLIEKLTADTLRVIVAYQDPVIYPNTDKTIWEFIAQTNTTN
ncbi:MAG: lipocalin family protein [Muribaculaceae bacterium]|nr:lipocalin family protein [Muribaculaceae bacterium]